MKAMFMKTSKKSGRIIHPGKTFYSMKTNIDHSMLNHFFQTIGFVIGLQCVAYAQINDSIPNINLIKIDSVVSMRVAPDQESVANLMDGSVYSTLVSSKTILSKGKSKKLIKYISKPKSFVMNEVANASNTHAFCFYAQGRTAVLLLFNVSTGFSRFGCYTPIEGFPREISASSPFFYEYKLTPRAQKKLKSLF